MIFVIGSKDFAIRRKWRNKIVKKSMLIEIRYPDTIIAFNKFAFFKLDELLMNLRIINKFRF